MNRLSRLETMRALTLLGAATCSFPAALAGQVEAGDRRAIHNLAGVVTDSSTGDPVPGVRVSVAGREHAVTGPDGTFELAVGGAPSIPVVLTFRRIGYEQLTRDVQVGTDQSPGPLTVSLSPLPVELVEIIVEGEPVPAKLLEFYARMERGWGDFLTEEDLDRLSAQNVMDVVSSVPGINYLSAGGANTAGSAGRIVFSRARCRVPTVYLDGQIFLDPSNPFATTADLLAVNVSDVAAVEIYNGASQVPIEFNRTGSACGVIVIWTK